MQQDSTSLGLPEQCPLLCPSKSSPLISLGGHYEACDDADAWIVVQVKTLCWCHVELLELPEICPSPFSWRELENDCKTCWQFEVYIAELLTLSCWPRTLLVCFLQQGRNDADHKGWHTHIGTLIRAGVESDSSTMMFFNFLLTESTSGASLLIAGSGKGKRFSFLHNTVYACLFRSANCPRSTIGRTKDAQTVLDLSRKNQFCLSAEKKSELSLC